MKSRLVLLPGFLGEATDFAALIHEVERRAGQDVQTEVLDWMNFQPDPTVLSLAEMGQLLCRRIEPLSTNAKTFILGYSLGGRLALALREALGGNAGNVQFIFVSTNPGLALESERLERRRNDAQWAQRFLTENWSDLLQAWNAQGVFQGSTQEPDRKNLSGRREALARILKNWSLAEQKNYRPDLKGDDLTWITGGLDVKFTGLAVGIPNSRTIPSASHRVHLDAPGELAEMVLKLFFKRD